MDNTDLMRYSANKKSLFIGYLLWFFIGGLGVHRFYYRQNVSGLVLLVITLLSIALPHLIIITGVWLLVDAFLMPSMCRDYNNKLIDELTGVESSNDAAADLL